MHANIVITITSDDALVAKHVIKSGLLAEIDRDMLEAYIDTITNSLNAKLKEIYE